MGASGTTAGPPHIFAERGINAYLTLGINNADFRDMQGGTEMTFHLGECTKVMRNVLRGNMNMPDLVPCDIGETDGLYLDVSMKGNTQAVKGTEETNFIMTEGIVSTFSVRSTVLTPEAWIVRPQVTAADFIGTKRGMDGGRSLALTSRDPRACIPVAAPQTITNRNLSGGCNLALTSRLPRA